MNASKPGQLYTAVQRLARDIVAELQVQLVAFELGSSELIAPHHPPFWHLFC